MYGTVTLIVVLLVISMFLIHFRGGAAVGLEGFAVAAVDPQRIPACVERSTAAQAFLARFAEAPVGSSPAVDELRLMTSKMCCMVADMTTGPSSGVYRTYPLQFRTSHDMEPASSIVARCLANAIPERDVELITEKFGKRGHELIKTAGCTDPVAATAEFDRVVAELRAALQTACKRVQPSMDHPIGARDMGFWESDKVAALSQYQGVSAAPK